MTNFTSNTYTLKRKILTFTNKIPNRLPKPERKFVADITYGMLAGGSCLLTDVADQLHEPSYLQTIKKWVPAEPVIHIDDSDVVKPD